ncbi:MAG: hypothetical protein AAFV93_04710 [Chloroflexota bacterium]
MLNDERLKTQYSRYAAMSRRLRADGIYEEALDAHQYCLQIARNLNDEVRIASCYFWIGECLYQLGRKEEAMMILTPNLKQTSHGSPDDLYNSMTKYIIIALDLPSRKSLIEDAIAHARQYLVDIGHLEWQHKILYLEAELYQMQGIRERALDLAIEGWATWRDAYPLFVADAHLFQIAMFQIRLKKIEDAENTLIEWENDRHNSFPLYRLAVMNRTRSHLHRLKGNYQQAMNHAQKAVLLTERMQTPESLATMNSSKMWAAICLRDFETARACITAIPLSILRRKAVLIGDYHLTWARHQLGLPVLDLAFHQQFPALPPVDERPTLSDPIKRALSRARMMYQIGMHQAKKFDEAFDCTWRQDEIKVCLDHISQLEQF